MKLGVALLCVALVGCDRARSVRATTHDSVRREMLRCTFDDAPGDVTQPDFEALLRREVRRDRMTFSVRAGRCESALDDTARADDPNVRAFARAWEEFLPLAQSPEPDDIALERAIRHVGNAWSSLR